MDKAKNSEQKKLRKDRKREHKRNRKEKIHGLLTELSQNDKSTVFKHLMELPITLVVKGTFAENIQKLVEYNTKDLSRFYMYSHASFEEIMGETELRYKEQRELLDKYLQVNPNALNK